MKEKVLFSWSGGKDSAYALYKLMQQEKYNIVSLYSTLSQEYKRVNFHAIPAEILDKQARCIGLPIKKTFITKSDSIEKYAEKLEPSLLEFKKLGVNKLAYGDIYLEDLRAFRIECLEKLGMDSIYPIWKTCTKKNIREFIDLGFRAVVTCVDTNVLGTEFVGKVIDDDFVNALPDDVDPCGENGEFHTFVYDGPIFSEPVKFNLGQKVIKENFCYCDLLPYVFDVEEELKGFIGKKNMLQIETLEHFFQNKVLKLYEMSKEIGVHFEIVSARRTFEEQKEIYDKYFDLYGESKVGTPGKGVHEKGLAIDIKIGDNHSFNENYSKVADLWKQIGGCWGGDNIDEYWHFQWGFLK